MYDVRKLGPVVTGQLMKIIGNSGNVGVVKVTFVGEPASQLNLKTTKPLALVTPFLG